MASEGRSIRSEYDYKSKKSFVDVGGDIMKRPKKSGLDGLEEMKKREGELSIKLSQKSRSTRKTGLSKQTAASLLSKISKASSK